MAKKYKGFKGSGPRETEPPKYETERLAKQILRMIMPKGLLSESYEEDKYHG